MLVCVLLDCKCKTMFSAEDVLTDEASLSPREKLIQSVCSITKIHIFETSKVFGFETFLFIFFY
jgi:hypothetical protein